MSAFDPLRTLGASFKVRRVNRIIAVAGVTAVVLMTAVMLLDANSLLWRYPGWAWGLICAAALGLCANALLMPRKALSSLAVVVSSLIGLALAWPVTVGGDSWRPVWLALGISMPLVGCWLLRSFSVAYRTK